MTRVLYITYDGLTDPLGGSQILPYLRPLARGRELHILSFEKPERYRQGGSALAADLRAAGIHWHPQVFTRGYRFVAKPYDLLKMHAVALGLALRYRIQIVHCRSYVAGQVGLILKRLLGTRFLFDMRGFWVDERVDGGAWNLAKRKDRWLFHAYKVLEKKMLKHADSIISLTRAAVPQLQSWLDGRVKPIQVIPCCADFDHFRPSPEQRARSRQEFNYSDENLVLCYLGSLGTWYMLPEMLALFAHLHSLEPRARLLVVSQDWGDVQVEYVRQHLPHLQELIQSKSANRHQVPEMIQAADLGVSLIAPAFSKTASSPTKMAEFLALGIPLLCNSGVGDVESTVTDLRAGLIVHDVHSFAFDGQALKSVLQMGGDGLRRRAQEKLSLDFASLAYAQVYEALESSSRVQEACDGTGK